MYIQFCLLSMAFVFHLCCITIHCYYYYYISTILSMVHTRGSYFQGNSPRFIKCLQVFSSRKKISTLFTLFPLFLQIHPFWWKNVNSHPFTNFQNLRLVPFKELGLTTVNPQISKCWMCSMMLEIMFKNQKQPKIFNFMQCLSSRFILLFVNSTKFSSQKENWK